MQEGSLLFKNNIKIYNLKKMKKSIQIIFMFLMIGLNAKPQTAYITNDSTVTVINVATNTIIDTIQVGSYPRGIAVSLDGTRVYVANVNDNTLSVINTANNSVLATIPVGDVPFGVA